MGYNEQYALVIDENFKGRVAMALVGVATYTKLEDPGTVDHAKRVLYANALLSSPMAFVKDYIYLVAAQPAINTKGPIFSLDADIDYVIAVNFTAKALAYSPGL